MLKLITKKIKKNRGFTLVELLVVVTIIGILVTILVVTVGDAIKRANDVERLAEVRQLAMILEGEVAIGVTQALKSVTPGACVAGAATTACNGPGGVSVFPTVHDDGAEGIDAPVCVGGMVSPSICHYGISNAAGTGAPMTNDYQICFYLEIGAGGLGPGLNSIRTGAILHTECK